MTNLRHKAGVLLLLELFSRFKIFQNKKLGKKPVKITG